MTRRPRAVLWDLDGTIADSKDFHWRAWRETMLLGGVRISYEQFLHSFGQRNDAILGSWLPGASPERVVRLGDAKEAAFRRLVAEGPLHPLPGAVEWIEQLARQGWRQAIASSAPRANVQTMARVLGLERVMGALVSAEDVHRGKPDPEVFLVSAQRLGVEPARSVVVEDAAAGIEAARRGGMRSIGVGGDALRAADVVVTALTDLPEDAFDRLVPEIA
ncbi:MAG: HAD family phosphatase [Gemmatimonadales bacterium]